MKKALLLVISCTLLLSQCSTEEKKTELIEEKGSDTLSAPAIQNADPIELIIIDLNGDKTADTILLKDKPNDPGLFTKIEIIISNHDRYMFNASDAWDEADKIFLKKYKNLTASKNVFITKDNDKTFILLFGFVYGSGRDEFSIIKVENNSAQLILDEDLEDIIKFEDLNDDRQMDLVCVNEVNRIDSINQQLKMEDPYYVFSIDTVFSFNLPLSIEYNNLHKPKGYSKQNQYY